MVIQFQRRPFFFSQPRLERLFRRQGAIANAECFLFRFRESGLDVEDSHPSGASPLSKIKRVAKDLPAQWRKVRNSHQDTVRGFRIFFGLSVQQKIARGTPEKFSSDVSGEIPMNTLRLESSGH